MDKRYLTADVSPRVDGMLLRGATRRQGPIPSREEVVAALRVAHVAARVPRTLLQEDRLDARLEVRVIERLGCGAGDKRQSSTSIAAVRVSAFMTRGTAG